MVVTRRLTESIAGALPLYLLLFVPLCFGLAKIYPWAAGDGAVASTMRRAIEHKHRYLNQPFFIVRTGIYFAVFIVVGTLLRALVRANDERPDLQLVLRMRRLSGGALPLVGLALTWASFDWTMSLRARLVVDDLRPLLLRGLVRRRHRPRRLDAAPVALCDGTPAPASRRTTRRRSAALLFAMIIFWAYMAFSQLLIYWIGDIPDEVSYYRSAHGGDLDGDHLPARVRDVRRAVLRALEPHVEAADRIPRVRRRVGVPHALRRRLLDGHARRTTAPACARTGSTSAPSSFVGGLSCAWIVQQLLPRGPRCRCTCPSSAEGSATRRRYERSARRRVRRAPGGGRRGLAQRRADRRGRRRRSARSASSSRALLVAATAGALRPDVAGPAGPRPAAPEISEIEQTPIGDTKRGIDMRDAQKRELEGWGWVDRDAGVATHPDRARHRPYVVEAVGDERPAPRLAQPPAAGVDVRPGRSTSCTSSSSAPTMLGATFVFLLALYFLVRYRRRAPGETTRFETTPGAPRSSSSARCSRSSWSSGSSGPRSTTVCSRRPRRDARSTSRAKQWMWKFSYADGRSSMDVLTVPVGRPVKLIMTSRDVIHSFYVPAFRMKQDVVPGRYYTAWFEATTPGVYAIDCAEYCGVEPLAHARRGARARRRRLRALAREAPTPGPDASISSSPREREVAQRARGCLRCHTLDGQPHIGPTWAGLYGSQVPLQGGETRRRRRGVSHAVDDGPRGRSRRRLQAGDADLPRASSRSPRRRRSSSSSSRCRTRPIAAGHHRSPAPPSLGSGQPREPQP